VRPVTIGSLERNPGPRDFVALLALVRALRAGCSRIVHSHAAKAGALGRLATLVAFRPSRRPILVHTFHGHSLTGYFPRGLNAIFLRIERFLGRRTDCLIAVSAEVRDELAQLGVALRHRIAVVRRTSTCHGFCSRVQPGVAHSAPSSAFRKMPGS
jgi:hypothetical protein